MNETFKKAAAFLYNEFKDQGGLQWAQEQFVEIVTDTLNSKAQPATKAPAKDPELEASAIAEGLEAQEQLESTEQPHQTVDLDELDDSKYLDEDAFANQVETTMSEMGQVAILSPEQVGDAVMHLITMAGEVRKFEEAQITKRVGIAANRDIALAQIKAQQELLQDYLNKSFDERAENFNKLFEVVDEALDTGNMQALAMGLESVVKLAASSPFKDLRSVEETAAALTNPDHEWDF